MRIDAVKLGAVSIVILSVATGGWVLYGALNSAEAKAKGKRIAAVPTNTALHPVAIKRPAGPPKVATGMTNLHGQAVTVACSTCHSTTEPSLETRAGADLEQFHQGLKYSHGNLSCLSCHNSRNYDTLRLADSRPVEFSDAMTLCAQCHGPQKRDYDMGLHGGMLGHWDLTKGGRTRSTCINCHDPHVPEFPLVMPVFPPRDRVLSGHKAHSAEGKHIKPEHGTER